MAKFDEQPKSPNVLKIIVTIAIIIAAILVIANSWFTVHNGERGILLTFGNPSDTIYSEGFHLKMPFIQTVEKFDIKIQTATFDKDTSLQAASKDLQDVRLSVVSNYHLTSDDVLYTFKTYGVQTTFNRDVVFPIMKEVVKSVSSQYTAEELVTKRINFSTAVETKLSEALREKKITLDKFNIVNFDFSVSFTQAIEEKVTAEQNALTAKNKLEQVKFEAEQQIATAQGQKSSTILKAEADAESIRIVNEQLQHSPSYIEYYKLQKWNGQLPQVTGTESSILIEMNASK